MTTVNVVLALAGAMCGLGLTRLLAGKPSDATAFFVLSLLLLEMSKL